jgi:hypothetical protein
MTTLQRARHLLKSVTARPFRASQDGDWLPVYMPGIQQDALMGSFVFDYSDRFAGPSYISALNRREGRALITVLEGGLDDLMDNSRAPDDDDVLQDATRR